MIKTEEIKRLFDRYYDRTTTEEGEKTLRTYFNSSDIDASLTEERFFFMAPQSSECPTPVRTEGRLSRQVSQWNTLEAISRRVIRHIDLHQIIGIAASSLLLFTIEAIAYQNENKSPQTEQDTYTNAEDVYVEAPEALVKFSKMLNKGTDVTENITNKTRDQIMKRIILTLCMTMITCITAFAQKTLFGEHSETDGVSTVYISHNMIRMMGNVKAGNKDTSKVAGRLDYLQTFSCERPSLIPSIKESAQNIFNQQKCSIIVQINEGGEYTTIYEQRYPNERNEFILLVIERNEITIINLLGNISLRDIQGITGGK